MDLHVLLYLLFVVSSRGSSDTGMPRIAYVTNTWWPKVDGAAISVMSHARFFASQGCSVLVVRPAYAADSPLVLSAAGQSDPIPPSSKLSFINFRTSGSRGGGFEPSMDPLDFPRVERELTAWAPDVLLVADPDLFLFDAFRIPGFNGMSRSSQPPPVTIACFTTFVVDAGLAMPEFWWMHNRPMRMLFEQAHSHAYAFFDHIFLNGETSLKYMQQHHALHLPWAWHSLADRARVVSSRGVSADFCKQPSVERCSQNPAVAAIRSGRSLGSFGLIYVGRLSYDKSVETLLVAFQLAFDMQKANGRRLPKLYVAGLGELDWLVRKYESHLEHAVTYLGRVQHEDVSCVLREADAYLSAAYNETYGRALVEAKRCSLPVITVQSCNLHVHHGVDGLLASNASSLAEQVCSPTG